MNNAVFRFLSLWFRHYSKFVLLAVLIFVSSFIVGLIVQQFLQSSEFKTTDYTWLDYFRHNTSQAAIMIALGIVTYGVGSYALLALNGFSLGVAVTMIIQNGHSEIIVTGLLPHAIFELPATLLCAVVPYVFWKYTLHKLKKKQGLPYMRHFAAGILSISSLLFIAAIIEAYANW